MESEIMVGVLAKKDPLVLAKAWIKKNPEWLTTWLEGLTTYDGKDAASASRAYFGL
jgi:glycine betaine/proline transport system substrate-binding protein